ncbi:MAG TPA: histidine kinase [Vicinamibacterales bacterium]|nr:histidine kinase [Vicinamibacterales bacterium]
MNHVAGGDPVMEERLPVPRLWAAFVAGWLVVLLAVGAYASTLELTLFRRAAALTCIGLLTVLYLWLALRDSLTSSDFARSGPAPALVRRRMSLLALMAGLVLALVALVPGQQMWWLLMHPTIAAGLVLPALPAAATIGTLVVLSFATAWQAEGRFEIMLLLLVAFAAGAVVIRQLTATVAQLGVAREALARAAVKEERLRIARDLHDLLGHSLSVIVLKAELAGRLLVDGPLDAATEVRDVERTARDALRQVRMAVAGYRSSSLEDELAAARELLAAAGIALAVEGRATEFPPPTDSLLGWAVREGVTNVVRHSGARLCTIRLTHDAQTARAEVTDDGARHDWSATAHGSGLAGLAERAAAHGGELQAGPRMAGGFSLVMTAPLLAQGGGRP